MVVIMVVQATRTSPVVSSQTQKLPKTTLLIKFSNLVKNFWYNLFLAYNFEHSKESVFWKVHLD